MNDKYCCMSDQQPDKKTLLSINKLMSELGGKTRIRGLGDLVARATDALHIPKCGACAERQKMLNRIVPFGKSENEQ